MIFPKLKGKRVGYVNLADYAFYWRMKHFPNTMDQPSPFNDPETCASMVGEAHDQYGVDWSYSGWLENRRPLWRGSYLDKADTFLHLGVDFNAPAGTEVAVDHDVRILRIEDDSPLTGGWGGHVVMEVLETEMVLLFGHLDETSIRVKPGQVLLPGDVLGSVGAPNRNGGWYTHIHVQAMTIQTYRDYEPRFDDLDGYGHADDLSELACRFPDPMQYVRIS